MPATQNTFTSLDQHLVKINTRSSGTDLRKQQREHRTAQPTDHDARNEFLWGICLDGIAT